MNRRLVHMLAMALVATALCADRATVASSEKTARATENRTLVGRLSSGIRRTVAPVRFVALRQPGRPSVLPGRSFEITIDSPVAARPVDPAQFPLPPPVL